jgi:hypothetical protein
VGIRSVRLLRCNFGFLVGRSRRGLTVDMAVCGLGRLARLAEGWRARGTPDERVARGRRRRGNQQTHADLRGTNECSTQAAGSFRGLQPKPPLLRAAIPAGMVLDADLPSPGPVISADANQLQQALTNLVINAWEAGIDGRALFA